MNGLLSSVLAPFPWEALKGGGALTNPGFEGLTKEIRIENKNLAGFIQNLLPCLYDLTKSRTRKGPTSRSDQDRTASALAHPAKPFDAGNFCQKKPTQALRDHQFPIASFRKNVHSQIETQKRSSGLKTVSHFPDS